MPDRSTTFSLWRKSISHELRNENHRPLKTFCPMNRQNLDGVRSYHVFIGRGIRIHFFRLMVQKSRETFVFSQWRRVEVNGFEIRDRLTELCKIVEDNFTPFVRDEFFSQS